VDWYIWTRDEDLLVSHHVEQVATTLYGFTSHLASRVVEHREKAFQGASPHATFLTCWFTTKSILRREKEIKGWRREKKLKLILAANPDWADLSLEWEGNLGWNLESDAYTRLKRKISKK
jgi:putative endonuclease